MSQQPRRVWADPRLATSLVHVAPVAVVVALLTGCASGGEDNRADPTPDKPASSRLDGPTNDPMDYPADDPGDTTDSTPTRDRTPPPSTEGARMSTWLPFGPLEVRAVDYRKAALAGAVDSRIDVVTVEECAERGSTLVRHTGWHLVDSSGRTLGTAGGKVVGGQPTEDIPQQLASGSCRVTRLVIGVPRGSTPIAVKDGPHATWILTD